MKYIFVLFIVLTICSSCASLNSLNDMNCKLSEDKRKNIIGKWKVITNDKKFIWRFYSDNSTATLENEYLTQIFDRPIYLNQWQNDKIDTLKVFFNGGRLQYYILSNQCREIVLVNTRSRDTLTLKRKQYFYK
ncbi:hypothetical protein [Emticicia agri]|uniref:Lipocalin-like domain-containing protein n=1 Tax=Emticicia agri TaxID=2492393 RepID=A0A4Q5LVN2_9BACT|nr:hypothetical protein [Emticicia agri]RYU93523.1 hypothetical protein EWM59_21700 [Emticicia agri]